ncbi:MAG: F0F1 ATP synthase subunit B [Planctomycetota bacterium]|nr:F0F1 ATP synthase subunit B [Planctomycetota bacterium]
MRTRILPSVLVAVLLIVCAAPAFAGDEGGGGLELGKQLDVKNIITSIVVFLLLLLLLSKTAWKPILEGLQKREETIQKALDDAEAAHEKAKALIAEYEDKIDHAREEAQAIFDEARRDADNIRSGIESEARKRADETVERAQREIDQRIAKAWDELVRDAAGIATSAAGSIIEKELSEEGHAEIVAGVVSKFTGSRAAPTVPPAGDDGEPA